MNTLHYFMMRKIFGRLFRGSFREISFALTTTLAIGWSVTGCFPLEAEQEYKDAIPLEDDLLVKLGASDISTKPTSLYSASLLDPYAAAGCENCCVQSVSGEESYIDGEIYTMTRNAKWHINGGLAVSMGWIWAIVNHPASQEKNSGYVWGPWQEDLARVRFQFEMEQSDDNLFSYQLVGQNINDTSDNWTPIVFGELETGEDPHAVSGTLAIDYSALHGLDTAHPTPTTGKISYNFDVTDYPYVVATTFEGFEYESGKTLNGTYEYQRLNPSMAGELSFGIEADMWPEEQLDGVVEYLSVSSKWNKDGKGAGQAVISEGSVENNEDNVLSATLNECWADSTGLFYTTYQASTVEFTDDTSAVTEVSCGQKTHCIDL